MSQDQKTVHVKDDLDESLEEKAPILPSPLADADHTEVSGEVMGAVEVRNADRYGGTWGLRLVADFPVQAMDVVEVSDRLEPGTYALVRVDEDEET